MWYTGIIHNQGKFAIYNSELGWNETVLKKLTGVIPTKLPKTSQIINGEFFSPDFAWHLSTDKWSGYVKNYCATRNGGAVVSGNI